MHFSAIRFLFAGLLAAFLLATTLRTSFGDEVAQESDYYRLETIEIPASIYLEVGAIEYLPDNKLAVSSRRGEIYLVEGARDEQLSNVRFQRFARGLHEVLGLGFWQGNLYATQRCEVTRLVDQDGDDRADRLETVSDGWGINGDYHEYAFGSPFDGNGKMQVVLCLTGSGAAADESHFRGWCLQVNADGETTPVASGIRSPGGIGADAAGAMFYTDNQGPWNGTCGLKHLRPGSFQGNPTGNKYFAMTDALGPEPKAPESGSRIMIEADRIPELEPTAVMFPYPDMGQSASGVACDLSGGKFGPFAEQLFVGDQAHSTVMRVYLEKVQGHYQGACFPFRAGFGSGNVALRFDPEGRLFVGGTNRGWGSRGRQPYALERLIWTGKVPFEILKMQAVPGGFRLTFTEPVDHKSASDPDSYRMETYTYIYQSNYGSPEVDGTFPAITHARVSDDGLQVTLGVEGLQRGHVHELHVQGVRSRQGSPLLHPVAYYTLNYFAE